MTVGEFCFKYERMDDEAKKKFVESHIKKSYVEYAVKIGQCEKIVKWSFYTKDGKFLPNTPMLEMFFVLGVIPKYTDLTLDESNGLHDYDQLIKSGAGSAILNSIGADAVRFREVLDMVTDDTIDRERNMIDFVSALLSQLGDIANELIEVGGNNGRDN